jgi:Glycosyltransferase like family
MSRHRTFTFVVAMNDRRVFEDNFLASACFGVPHAHEILVQEGFWSASKAYNDAIARCKNDLIIFAHQDVIFPEGWLGQVEDALDYLERSDPDWGVLGCYGETRGHGPRGQVYSSGLGIIGAPLNRPMPVQTLDEIVLILRRSSRLRFDDNLPQFHFYGADICLTAKQRGMPSYVIPAFCIHNSSQGSVLPEEFYECYHYFKAKWKSELPICTACMQVTMSDLHLYKRRAWEFYVRLVHPARAKGCRIQNIGRLMDQLTAAAKTPRTIAVP